MRLAAPRTARRLLAAALAAAMVPAATSLAQTPPPVADPLVTMDFPDDGVELSLLADLVTRRLRVPILYDESIRGKKVVIRVPTKVPESALMGILQSALRLKGMALVDAGQPGWKQIVDATSPAAALPASGSVAVTRFVPLLHAEATTVAAAVQQLVSGRDPAATGNVAIVVTADERSNQVVVAAPESRMAEVLSLIAGMDRGAELQTRVYRLRAVGPERVDGLVRSLLDPASLKRGYQSGVDRDGQALVVSATPAVHERVAQLVRDLDVPAPQSSNPIQFYKLRNTKAAELLATINGLLGDSGGPQPDAPPTSNDRPAYATKSDVAPLARASASNAASPLAADRTAINEPRDRAVGAQAIGGASIDRAAPAAAGVLSVRNRDATVAADLNTNSVIVIGPPPVQAIYADLIKRLDQRRPQVQIECTIVTLDTTDDLTFGIDIGKLGGFENGQLLTLSSFGVSTTDPATGRLTPVGARGGTFALLSPGIADVVLRTLQTDSRARLVSAPQLLVNDNGTGKLESVAQEPYAVILDSNSTQSQTSFGGLASAGTSISVEPHISEADYLQLTYSIEQSAFTGAAQGGLPPPSQKSSVDSAVTIPDGYTIVVGGLSTRNYTAAVNKIPLLGDIPILGYLFGARSRNLRNTTLFVFIRPVILRDDRFEDLKYLSGVASKAAAIDGDFPASEPVPMR